MLIVFPLVFCQPGLCFDMVDRSRVVGVPGDVADEGDMMKLAAETLSSFGNFDTWINNAGVSIIAGSAVALGVGGLPYVISRTRIADGESMKRKGLNRKNSARPDAYIQPG